MTGPPPPHAIPGPGGLDCVWHVAALVGPFHPKPRCHRLPPPPHWLYFPVGVPREGWYLTALMSL